jgi:hypothetical protein
MLMAAEYSLMSLASWHAGELLEVNAPVSNEETHSTVDRIEKALIASAVEIMRHEWRRMGGSKDPSWPGLRQGHA